MKITESEITLNFPDGNYFRFETCEAYKKLSHIKEMDACWYDEKSDILYMIELKNWENSQLEEEQDPTIPKEKIDEHKKNISKYRVNELCKKSIDSVSMILSIIIKTPYSSRFQTCLPFKISSQTKITLLSIVNWTEKDDTYISMINSEYRTVLNSYAKLFNIKTFLVLTKARASQLIEWVD